MNARHIFHEQCNVDIHRGFCEHGDDDICPKLNEWTHLDGYHMIVREYGDKCAKRSGVPLINHIHEGLKILKEIGASEEAKEAYCIHPIIQADNALTNNRGLFQGHPEFFTLEENPPLISPYVMLLAMEYRFRANAFLSDKVCYDGISIEVVGDGPTLSPLREVNDMLIADKVQNRKDFDIYHKATHARSKELTLYFNLWLQALGVDERKYKQLIAKL